MNDKSDARPPHFPVGYAEAEPFTGTTEAAMAIVKDGCFWHDPVTGRAILTDRVTQWRFEPEGGANAVIAALFAAGVLRRDDCMEEGIDIYVGQP